MKVLVWHWGRYGAGPRIAAAFAHAFAAPRIEVALSLSRSAELLRAPAPPPCQLPIDTYASVPGFLARAAAAPLATRRLARRLAALAPDFALCAMPAPLDFVMAAALRRAAIPFAVVVHDADLHPGDGYPLQMTLQRRLLRRADRVVALTAHVAERVLAQGLVRPESLLRARLPSLPYGDPPAPPAAHGGPIRLLSFGRLLAYKGLDLLADALAALPTPERFAIRVVGEGPESPALRRLRALPGVQVENRWVPEEEVGPLLAWSDALVLSHREASQSGVAAAALAAGRWIVSTNVGGLAEQLGQEPAARLCEPDAASLAAAIAALATDPPAVPAGALSDTRWSTDARRLVTELAATLAPGRAHRPVAPATPHRPLEAAR